MRKQGKQPENRDDLELNLVRFMSHAFRQRMDTQEQQPKPDHSAEQNEGRHHHHYVGVARLHEEARQVMGRGRV
jgi:hypothetical protein